MAGPGKGTWVKVKSKGGAVRTEVIGATVGGNNYSKGEVISQSEYQQTQKQKSEGSSGNTRADRQARIAEIKGNIRQRATDKAQEIFGPGSKGINDQTIARFNRTKAGRQGTALANMERNAMIPVSGGSGNRAKRRLAEMRGETVPKYKSLGEARLGFQKQQKQEGKRLQKAALSKAEKTQILLKNKKQLKKEAMKTEGGYDRVKRLNRLEAADRKRRKAENPNAPSFRRAQKGNQTKYLKSLGIG